MQAYLQDNYEGPIVLKGQTNSKRELWLSHMFANNKEEARKVYCNLLDDSLIKQQNIYIRKYEPLKSYCLNVMKMPICKEFRFFVMNQKILCGGFYWSNFEEECNYPDYKEVPVDFLNKIINIIGDNCNFYALDVAQKENGEWTVIELNDGSMSGLSCIEPEVFYQAIAKELDLMS